MEPLPSRKLSLAFDYTMSSEGRAADRVLLTGATGYVGGRLLRVLESRGYRVRCMARNPHPLASRVGPDTEVVQGDVTDPASLRGAMRGVFAAYYLVHSMGSSGRFDEEDREGARAFGLAAAEAGVGRIIYLGGLGRGDSLSPHLASRQEVGKILRESGVPTIEFRASVIIGSGSLSFEMVRSLVESLPVMVTPRWVLTPTQPIAVEDVIEYLAAAVHVPLDGSRVFEIGGPDRVSYLDLLREYARQRGLKRLILPVPVLTPWLSSLWLGLVTPLYARVGRKLIDSVRNETVVTDDSALEAFAIRPRGFREAIERALANEDREYAETRWSDALSSAGRPRSWGGVRFGPRIVDSRVRLVRVPPEQAFEPIQRIGGANGWYYGDWLWRLRGALDLLVGGPGMRRGRRHPEEISPGEPLDFWTVEAFERNHLLRLVAGMKVPGRAWLQFEVIPANGGSQIRQTAVFDPAGVSGRLYWYLLYPIHAAIFGGMLREIARRAERENGK